MVSLFPLIHKFCVLRVGFGCHFGVFWSPWGYFFWLLRVLETGLKFYDFFRDSLGDPRSWQHAQVRVTPSSPGPVNSYQSQIADLQTAKSRYQTDKLAFADWGSRKDWQKWLSSSYLKDLKGLEGPGSVSLKHTLRSFLNSQILCLSSSKTHVQNQDGTCFLYILRYLCGSSDWIRSKNVQTLDGAHAIIYIDFV